MAGTLLVVSTPIGNLEDITLRAFRILREADLIAAEDTRRTGRLLQHYEHRDTDVSLHEHNEREKSSALLGPSAQAAMRSAWFPMQEAGHSDPGLTWSGSAVFSGSRAISARGLSPNGGDGWSGAPMTASQHSRAFPRREAASERRGSGTQVACPGRSSCLKRLTGIRRDARRRAKRSWASGPSSSAQELTKLHES